MPIEPRNRDSAAQALSALSAQLPWSQEIETRWPAPIAHEYARLWYDVSTGDVYSALVQMKDLSELLVKFAAIVAGRLLLNDGSPRQKDMACELLLARQPPALGKWASEATKLCAEVCTSPLPALREQTHAFGAALSLLIDLHTGEPSALGKLLGGKIVQFRNKEIGHGALRLDWGGYPSDMAPLLRDLLEELATQAEGLAALRLLAPIDSGLALVGADGLSQHQAAVDAAVAAGSFNPLVLVAAAKVDADEADPCHPPRLGLGPFIYLHRTRAKQAKGASAEEAETGIYVLDKRIEKPRIARLHFFDYRTNERATLYRADNRPEMLTLLDALTEDESISQDAPEGDSFDKEVQDFLDGISVQREYAAPVHFRDALRGFTGHADTPTRDRGILWVSAPADVGKTTFAFSLATLGHAAEVRQSFGEKRMWGDMACLVFAIRREYRSTWASLEAHVLLELGRSSNESSLTLSAYLLAPEFAGQPRRAFAAWLQRLRLEAARKHGRLLLVIDALDELPTGNAADPKHDLLDVLPSADELPTGVFLLLTSRCDPAGALPEDANPPAVQATLERLHRESSPALLTHIDLQPTAESGAVYRDVLQTYFERRVSSQITDEAERAELFERVLQHSEHRFKQLAYYTAVIAAGVLRPEQLELLGSRLLEEHLRALEIYERKRFPMIRRIVLELAAAEEAHAAEIHWQEPAPVMPREWLGLDLLELARRCGDPAEHPHGLSARFLAALQTCAELLCSYRGLASNRQRFALGLKGMLGQLAELDGWSTVEVHHRVISEAIDDFHQAQEQEAREAALLRAAGPALALCGRVQPFLDVTVAESIDRVCFTLAQEANEQRQDQAVGVRLVGLAFAAWLLWNASEFDSNADADNKRNHELASCLAKRANYRQSRQQAAEALVDYDRAVAVFTDLVERLGERCPPAWQLNLASAQVNRANAKQHAPGFGAAAALVDYDRAVAVCTDLVEALGQDCQPSWHIELATSHMNRGVARLLAPGLGTAAALADFDRATALLTALVEGLGEDCLSSLHNRLANALMNRGNAKQHAPGFGAAAALVDFDRAVALLTDLVERLGEDCPSSLHNDLANAHMNRGVARLHAPGFGAAAALADHDRAITRRTDLVDRLGERCPPLWHQDLAKAHINRGVARAQVPDFGAAAALADFDRATALLTALVERLGKDCPPSCHEDLAGALMNRGNAKQHAPGFGAAAALADFDRAVALLTDLVERLGKDCPPAWLESLASGHRNRARVLQACGRDDEAAQDQGRADQLDPLVGSVPAWLFPAPDVGDGWPDSLEGSGTLSQAAWAALVKACPLLADLPGTVSSVVRKLACLPSGVLIEVKNTPADRPGRTVQLLFHPDAMILLDGSSDPVNAAVGLNLIWVDDEFSAGDYMRLVCNNLLVGDGVCSVIETPDDIPWQDDAPEAIREEAARRLLPLRPLQGEDGAYQCEISMLYAKLLFKATLRLDGGKVEMLNQSALLEDLPVRVTRIEDGWRITE